MKRECVAAVLVLGGLATVVMAGTQVEVNNAIPPALATAIAEERTLVVPKRDIGLDIIHNVFPSGYYHSTSELPHTGDVSLCPADGFYIWNTQQPDKPTFEMGKESVFIFNLGQFIKRPRAFAAGGWQPTRCDYSIQSGYCMNNKMADESPIGSYSANTLNCHAENEGPQQARALALISTASRETISPNCLADAPATSTGIASLPVSLSGDEQRGFEFAIESMDGVLVSRANCRYVRGRLH